MLFKFIFSTIILVGVLLSLHLPTIAHGIVIADEKKQTEFFNTDSCEIMKFAEEITSKYDRVILHLGRSYVFRNGNIYTSEMSRKNLKLFAEILQSKGVPLILWFFDSFGNESFGKLYAEYTEICNENVQTLDSLKIPFHGIAVDMEWVNLNNGNNNVKLEEIIRYLRNKLEKDKKLYFFASLHESDEENYSRGYTRELLAGSIATPIAMLYPLSSGFYLEDIKLTPFMSDYRINTLISHYRKVNWEVTVAMGDKWICQKKHKNSELEILTESPVFTSKQLRTNFTTKQEFWTQRGYTVLKSFRVKMEEGKKARIRRGDMIYHLIINQSLAGAGNYIWEYYDLQPKEL